MKISCISQALPVAKKMYSTLPQSYNRQVSFQGDSFCRQNNDEQILDSAQRIEKAQKEALQKLLEEMNNARYSSLDDELYKRANFQSRLDSIRSEYQKIDRMLSSSAEGSKAINYQIIADYFEAKNRMAKDKGFNRIQGYDSIKAKLSDKFCIDIMLNDRLEQTSFKQAQDVPDIVFFYGPTGTGKTTFAKALGEESLSELLEPDWVNAPNNDAKMELIEDCARKAQEIYQKSNGKKRSIILLNEADSLIKRPDPKSYKYEEQKRTIERFINFAQNCSKNYKCTLFITTNEPLRVDERILSKEITPIKVGVGPCDKNTAKQILENCLAAHNVTIETDEIINELFQRTDRKYSNSNIVNIVENIMMTTSNPTKEDFLELINDDEVPPSILPRDMKKFMEAKQALYNLTDAEWKDLI